MARLLSLGHSTKTMDEFVALLRGAGIEAVFDIRRYPRSRRHPHFVREALERALAARGFDYMWLGDELGGFRDEGYDTWMRTDVFDRGLRALEASAQTKLVGFMCSEGEPWKCHRLHVSRALSQRGHEVSHLLPGGAVVPEDPPTGGHPRAPEQLTLPDL